MKRQLLPLLFLSGSLSFTAVCYARSDRDTNNSSVPSPEMVWYAPVPSSRLALGTCSLIVLLLPSGATEDSAASVRLWKTMAEDKGMILAVSPHGDPASLGRFFDSLTTRKESFDRARCFLAAIGPEARQAAVRLMIPGVTPVRIASFAQFAAPGASRRSAKLPVPIISFDTPPDAESVQKAAQFFAAHPAQTRLTVRVTGLRSDRGSVVVALFHTSAGFPDSDDKAWASATIPANVGSVSTEIIFPALPPGEYAVSLFHDENNDRKFNTSFGFPTEGFGVSNNPKPRFGPPHWSDAKFVVTGTPENTTIDVRMQYLGSR